MLKINLTTMNAKRFLGMFLMAVLGGLIALFAYTKFSSHPGSFVVSADQPQMVRLAQLPEGFDSNRVDFTYAAERTIHAVVHVKVTSMQNQGYSNPFYEFFFGDRMDTKPQPVSGFGSGVIISEDGYIVTNNHVIDGAEKIEVTLNNKHTYTAELIGRDPDTDIAVIKIKEDKMPFITYGNSDALKIGEWVLAVGNPYNLTSTVTAGIVSAKARNLSILGGRGDRERPQSAIESFIQTDAAVNPGNSGGALVNTRGELIGINTAIASPTGSYIGNSFAIPVTIVKKVVGDLIEYGKVQRAMLGVQIKDIDEDLAKKKGLDKIEGVYIDGLSDGSAAESAGIKEGDVITSVNGQKVNSMSELQEQVSRFRPNDKVEIEINRDNKKKQFLVTLRNSEGTTKIVRKDEITSILGAQLTEVSPSEKSKLGIRGGVKVTDIGSGKLRSEGVQKGFIITSINNKAVASVDDVKSILSGIKGGVYIEGVYPNGVVAYYAFGI
jgi:Do/DeqQ family serine protease